MTEKLNGNHEDSNLNGGVEDNYAVVIIKCLRGEDGKLSFGDPVPLENGRLLQREPNRKVGLKYDPLKPNNGVDQD